MRAHTKGKHGIRKRFAVVIGVAAVGVMALGAQTVMAQTAAQPPAVVKYDTRLDITHEAGPNDGVTSRPSKRRPGSVLWHGGVESDRTECLGGRRVILFKKQRGADRKLGTDRSRFHPDYGEGGWGLRAPTLGRVYARVTPKVGDGFVCRADRSRTIINGDLCFEDPSFCNPPTPAPTPRGQAPPTCKGKPATIVGTASGENLRGTPGPDVIVGLGGGDIIRGGPGNDVICGGKGQDLLDGDGGNDTLLGQAARDFFVGGQGTDRCEGGKGPDTARSNVRNACEVEKSIKKSGLPH
jgi:hypothetical protein